MDDLMPETLTQPFMGMGDPRWYFGQIRLFPELGAPSPDPHGHSDPGVWGPPQASTQAQCGPQCGPQQGPEDAECSGGGLRDSRTLGARKAWRSSMAWRGSGRGGIWGGGVAPPPGPRAANTHPQGMTGRDPGQGCRAGLQGRAGQGCSVATCCPGPCSLTRSCSSLQGKSAGTGSPGSVECLHEVEMPSAGRHCGAPCGARPGWVQRAPRDGVLGWARGWRPSGHSALVPRKSCP